MEPVDKPVISYSPDDIEKVLEHRLKFVSEVWGFASAYDAAITIGGYGAFFALWSGVSSDVTPAARTLTAALMGVSLFLYIVWSITLMIARHWYDREFSASLEKVQSPIEALNEWEGIEIKRMRALLVLQKRLWLPVFGSTVALGFSGALLLVYNCVAIAAGWPQVPSAG